jgi:16S rRNA processing protein RimM
VRHAHGIRGEVLVESITDDPDAVFAAGRQLVAGTVTGEVAEDAPILTVRRASPHKGGWILRLEEIADRTAAEPWRDRYLLAPAAALTPPAAGEVYFHELVGLRVERADGGAVGTVAAWFDLPHGLLLEVSTPAGAVMLPYRPELITRVDVERGTIVVDPPPGFLD